MDLLPLFVNLEKRRVLLVGGGRVAASKLHQLIAAGAEVRVVAPEACADIARVVGSGARHTRVTLEARAFEPSDLDEVWLVISAATPGVNAFVAAEAERRRILVNAVDDPANATIYLGGVVRRGGVTIAISTHGAAPALAGLLRQAIDALLPVDIDRWLSAAGSARQQWRREAVPIERRRPLLLQALNRLYAEVQR